MTISEKLTQIAENEQKVFDAGYEKGKAEGYQNGYDEGNAEGIKEGIEEGKQAEYDAFWDNYQTNGTRIVYDCAFAGWSYDTFRPKYDIKPTSAYMLFRTFDTSGWHGDIDMSEHLKECGVVLDTSQCTNFQYMCMNSFITHLGIIDTRSATTLYEVFSCNRLHTVDKLILKDDGSQTFSRTFHATVALENIVIEGVIGKAIDFSPCKKLTRASIESIVAALSTTTNDLTCTFSKTAVFAVYNASDDDWGEFLNEVVMPHGNWNFSLI